MIDTLNHAHFTILHGGGFYIRWQEVLVQEGQILTLVDSLVHKEGEFLCSLASSYTASGLEIIYIIHSR
jgi:hypothetical protein